MKEWLCHSFIVSQKTTLCLLWRSPFKDCCYWTKCRQNSHKFTIL